MPPSILPAHRRHTITRHTIAPAYQSIITPSHHHTVIGHTMPPLPRRVTPGWHDARDELHAKRCAKAAAGGAVGMSAVEVLTRLARLRGAFSHLLPVTFESNGDFRKMALKKFALFWPQTMPEYFIGS